MTTKDDQTELVRWKSPVYLMSVPSHDKICGVDKRMPPNCKNLATEPFHGNEQLNRANDENIAINSGLTKLANGPSKLTIRSLNRIIFHCFTDSWLI